MSFCHSCGANIEGAGNFCSRCGANTGARPAARPEQIQKSFFYGMGRTVGEILTGKAGTLSLLLFVAGVGLFSLVIYRLFFGASQPAPGLSAQQSTQSAPN